MAIPSLFKVSTQLLGFSIEKILIANNYIKKTAFYSLNQLTDG
jgi:hypothetical protein